MHVAQHLMGYVSGTLGAAERAQTDEHLRGCKECADELSALRGAAALMPPLPPNEPRVGFAARVALAARDGRLSSPWWRLRWAAGGLAVAGVAAAVLVLARPQGRSGAGSTSDELVLAQKLDLYEDLSVIQNQEALEDLDVVEVLHTLQPEGKP